MTSPELQHQVLETAWLTPRNDFLLTPPQDFYQELHLIMADRVDGQWKHVATALLLVLLVCSFF